MEKKDIKIVNINKSFDGVPILKNVNLEIEQGEFFTIIGPSGCGKTTLLRMIAGFISPDSGAIYLGDENIIDLPPNLRNVNTIFQKYALFPHLNVYDNVAFSLRLKKTDEKIVDEEVKKYLKLVGLEEHSQKMPNQLSGGQQQRVSIARALINKPGVLLLDEPLSALDAKLRQNLLIELDLIHDEVGITFIFITHDQQEALSISDRIAVMNKGEILQVGTPAEVYEAPANPFVADFLGENNFFSGRVTEIINDELAKINIEGLGEIITEQDRKVKVGDFVNISLRPEKIRLSKTKLNNTKNTVNSFAVYVDEYIYSGFQSKYYVHLKENEDLKFKIFLQHAAFFDDNDKEAIWWDEDAYISWDAYDSYLVEVVSDEKK
ncbi:MAG: ABC transporter ATP-binding protein [Fusobacterium gastrosuis]|uniref:ABC transporter ATP-binding protein n=2 Tax=Fusobacteriaceae TaxID=203492 RepID=UPI001F4F4B96|nr:MULTISPECIES: ABC transporter ATP-binding protein [Fusobacterium]MDD7391303.1 ABC transporter ATP-binding protein [Fusobacteriaceae bacterium]MCI5725011.1 ABC transporter ATP-binding protein [Fusobacterium sp.]MCI7223648.1 ABC transporter ATP-binding protein [Fusobacterium sp.]MDD7410997.1 ABC transporter ATP-binding protein [Fusobacteriaceae bacterium]MDY4010116.1 ABC transporter ATP-binding protein [Fusobacterium gastrosuis]